LGSFRTVKKDVDILDIVEKQMAPAPLIDSKLRLKIKKQWEMFASNDDNSVSGKGERFHLLLAPGGATHLFLCDRVKDLKKDFIETTISYTLAGLLVTIAYFYYNYFW